VAAKRVVGSEPRPAAEGTGRLIIRVARELRTAADHGVEPLGLTMQQAELLIWTYLSGDVNPVDLTELLLTDQAGVSRLVDRLEAKGLVARRRDPLDRRAQRLRITPSGRRVARRLRALRASANRHLFGWLSPREENTLRGLLLKVLGRVRTMPWDRA